MCGVKLKDRLPSKELRERLGVDDIALVLQQNRLRWYGHVLRKDEIYTYTHTHLMAFFPGRPRWAGTRKVEPIWILPKQETQWLAVASAGPYASLHLAPDR